jgi:AhpD family alkylhydroperoxidase
MSHARSELEDFQALAPDAYDLVAALGRAAAKAGIDKQLLVLIKLRASQINGCAFCVQFHILQGESLGISADKLNLVVVWREAPLFSARERAALAWTEALTLLTQGVSDEVHAQAAAEFSEKELAYLSSAIASINVWNRLGVAYRWTPPARQKAVAAGDVGISCRCLPGCRDGSHLPAAHGRRRASRSCPVRTRGRARE